MRIAAVVLLLLFAAAAPAAAGRWLPGAAWPSRAPRAGITAWLAGSLSVAFSLVLSGLILAVPCLPAGADPAMLRACLALLRTQYASPAGAAAGLAGGALMMTVLGRVTWYYCSAAAAARRCRARHDEVLAIIARPGPATDVRIIDSGHPAVYCLPGRRRIVLTTATGALDCLDGGQLDAVLAHERAHLSGRHHLVLRLAAALERAFSRVRFFAAAAEQVAYLVEVAADDAAARRAPRLTVAAALLAVAAAGIPAGSLGAGGSAAARRIERLIAPPLRGSRARRAVACAALAMVTVLAVTAVALAFSTIIRCPGASLSL